MMPDATAARHTSAMTALMATVWLVSGLVAVSTSFGGIAVIGGSFAVFSTLIALCNRAMTLHELFPRALLVVCIAAFMYVTVQSDVSWWVSTPAVMLGLLLIGTLVVRPASFSDLPISATTVPLLVFAVLALQGWLFLAPLIIAAGILGVLGRLRSDVYFKAAYVPLVALGATLSRIVMDGNDSRFFVSYDQLFRASMGASLARWGWSDWNALAGSEIRYHWLSEAAVGSIARVAGLDTFVAIGSLWPMIIMFAAVSVLLTTAHVYQFPRAAALLTLIVAAFVYQLEFSSVGTMLGSTLLMTALSHTPEAFAFNERRDRSWWGWVALAVPSALLPLAQSTTAIMFSGILGALFIRLLPRRNHRIFALAWLGGIAVIYVLLSQTLLKAGLYGVVHSMIKPEWIPRFLGADAFRNAFLDVGAPMLTAASYWWVLWGPGVVAALVIGRRHDRMSLVVMVGAGCAALALIIFVRIGGFEYRITGELTFLVLFFVLGLSFSRIFDQGCGHILAGAILVAVSAWRLLAPRQLSYETVNLVESSVPLVVLGLGILISGGEIVSRTGCKNIRGRLVLAPIVLVVVVILASDMVRTQRSIDLMTRERFDMEAITGGAPVDECLTWIRNNTSTNTIVASDMWRLPRSDDQKYYIVSARTERLVLVDGPDYVTNMGVVPREIIESMKNQVDAAVQRPSVPLLTDLAERGASVLVVDRKRNPDSRVGWFTKTVVRNEACSVHLLPSRGE